MTDIEYRTGNLFASGLPAIGHGVNCRGVMGAGIAGQFRRRWPAMYTAYRAECRAGRLQLGGLHVWRCRGSGMWVYNLATQDRPGPHATLHAVEASLTAAVEHAAQHGIPHIGIPRIGAGIGGLHWPDVAAVIRGVAETSQVAIVVVTLPGDQDQPHA